MGIGFKTGFLGYSKQEVNRFIQQQAELYKGKAAEQEKLLKKQQQELSVLHTALKELEEKQKELESEVTFLNGQLEHYRGREEEIEKMSVGIGTMYLASRKSATEIIERAEQCAQTVAERSRRQLTAAAETQGVLDRLQTGLRTAAEGFAKELDTLHAELAAATQEMNCGLAALEQLPTADTAPEQTDGQDQTGEQGQISLRNQADEQEQIGLRDQADEQDQIEQQSQADKWEQAGKQG